MHILNDPAISPPGLCLEKVHKWSRKDICENVFGRAFCNIPKLETTMFIISRVLTYKSMRMNELH